jgi:hypothetical protein
MFVVDFLMPPVSHVFEILDMIFDQLPSISSHLVIKIFDRRSNLELIR